MYSLDGGVAEKYRDKYENGAGMWSRDVLLQRILAELTTDTGLLEATEWDLWVQLVNAVDLSFHVSTRPYRFRDQKLRRTYPSSAGLQSVCDLERAVNVL